MPDKGGLRKDFAGRLNPLPPHRLAGSFRQLREQLRRLAVQRMDEKRRLRCQHFPRRFLDDRVVR